MCICYFLILLSLPFFIFTLFSCPSPCCSLILMSFPTCLLLRFSLCLHSLFCNPPFVVSFYFLGFLSPKCIFFSSFCFLYLCTSTCCVLSFSLPSVYLSPTKYFSTHSFQFLSSFSCSFSYSHPLVSSSILAFILRMYPFLLVSLLSCLSTPII